MRLLLEREYLAAGTTGALSIDGVYFCVTLERTREDPEHPCIIEGIFVVTWQYSPHLKYDCPHIAVLGRVGILIHSGQFVADSKGCPMVGSRITSTPDLEIHGGLVDHVKDKLYALVQAACAAGPVTIEVKEQTHA